MSSAGQGRGGRWVALGILVCLGLHNGWGTLVHMDVFLCPAPGEDVLPDWCSVCSGTWDLVFWGVSLGCGSPGAPLCC